MQKAKLKILFIFSLLFLFGCKPDIIDITNIQIERQGVKIDILINNPNIFAITLSNIKMDLYIDNYKFKDLIYEPKIRLKPLSKKYYPLTVDIKPLEHPYQSTGAMMSLLTQDSTLLQMRGTVLVKSLFFKKRVKFSEKIYIKYNKNEAHSHNNSSH